MALEADLAKMSERVCGHMNPTTPFAAAWAPPKCPASGAATMTDANRTAELELTKADGYVMPKVLIPLNRAGEGGRRTRVAARCTSAFNGLGWQYKLANGFYTGAARQRHHMLAARQVGHCGCVRRGAAVMACSWCRRDRYR